METAKAGADSTGLAAFSELNQNQVEALAVALGLDRSASREQVDTALALVSTLATREYVMWLLGIKRYESVSAMERDRLVTLFGKVWRRMPTVQELVEDLGYSEGRAVAALSRMRFGAARTMRAWQLRDLAVEIATLRASKPTKPNEFQPLTLPDRLHKQLWPLLVELTEEKPDDISSQVVPEKAAQRGWKWNLLSKEWAAFEEWLKAPAKRELDSTGQAQP